MRQAFLFSETKPNISALTSLTLRGSSLDFAHSLHSGGRLVTTTLSMAGMFDKFDVLLLDIGTLGKQVSIPRRDRQGRSPVLIFLADASCICRTNRGHRLSHLVCQGRPGEFYLWLAAQPFQMLPIKHTRHTVSPNPWRRRASLITYYEQVQCRFC